MQRVAIGRRSPQMDFSCPGSAEEKRSLGPAMLSVFVVALNPGFVSGYVDR